MNRIIVVTGAASGMGKATADLMASRGDKIIRVDIKGDMDVIGDLSTKAGRQEVLNEIYDLAPGYVDGVIGWAGLGQGGVVVLAVNYFGQIDLLNGLRPLLEKSKAPRVVVTSSRNALYEPCEQLVQLCLDGKEEEAMALCRTLIDVFPVDFSDEHNNWNQAYISSKVACARWMRKQSVAPEWGGKGILINGIAPGLVVTPMTAGALEPGHPARDYLFREHPQAINAPDRLNRPEEAAELSAFLLSPQQSILVGQMLFMDYGTEAILRGDRVY